MHDIQRRNTAIRKHFYELLGQGMPIMLAYAMTGKEFYLSEKRVRDIIAKRKWQVSKIDNKKCDLSLPLHSRSRQKWLAKWNTLCLFGSLHFFLFPQTRKVCGILITEQNPYTKGIANLYDRVGKQSALTDDPVIVEAPNVSALSSSSRSSRMVTRINQISAQSDKLNK